MWDVGNFLLDPPSEQNNRDHREDEQENNKEETKNEPKVNCLAHYYLSPLPICFFCHLSLYQSQWQKVGKETPNFVATQVVRNIT